MRETRKPQKLGTARIALEGNGRLGEAVADVEDSEAAEASEGAEDRGVPRGTAERRGGRGSHNCQSVQFSQFVVSKSASCLEVR